MTLAPSVVLTELAVEDAVDLSRGGFNSAGGEIAGDSQSFGLERINVHVAGVAGRAENEVARGDRGDLGAKVLEDVAAVAGERERGGVAKSDARGILVGHGLEVDRTDGGRLINGEGAVITGNTGVTGKVETADGLGVERFALLQRQRTVGEDNLDAAIIVDEVLSGIEVGERVFEGLGRQVDGTGARDGIGGFGGFVGRVGYSASACGGSLFLEETAGVNREGAVGESESRSTAVRALKDRKALVARHREGAAVQRLTMTLPEFETSQP